MDIRNFIFSFALILFFGIAGMTFSGPESYAQDQAFPASTNLNLLQSRYLNQCDSLDINTRRIQYQLSRITFVTLEEASHYADSLQGIQTHLETQLSQCNSFPEVSSTLSTVQNLFDIALQSREIKHPNRSLFFYFEDVPTIYQDDIEAQIRTEIDVVENVFENDLNLSTGHKSLVFFITNRRIMEKDVGGANIGSFIWLPLEFSLGYGQKWPDGVRESTVRHEIVHAFMNLVTTSPVKHAYPKVFVEGIALYLSDNKIIEFHRRTQVRLSDEYIDFLHTFEHMEEQGGRRALLSFIREMLTGEALNFAEGFEQLSGTSYEAYLASQPSFSERTVAFINNTLRISRRQQRYISVFGSLFVIALLFLTVQLPQNKREEVRRNIGVAFLTFIIVSFLSQGRIVEMAANNYFPFLLLSLFMAVLLRGYPYVRHEDLIQDLQERSLEYMDEEGEGEEPLE
ncbi:MAG: hypothetical protein KTR29_10570 [Rhodothermaceae bacterium]|nr:hypothetical protein [Rhodothermaceae bacterium]